MEELLLLTEELATIIRPQLQEPVFVEINRELTRQGLTAEACHNLVRQIDEHPQSHHMVVSLKQELEQRAPELTADFRLERFLLLNSARLIVDAIPNLSVSQSVKSLYRDEFTFFASTGIKTLGMFQAGKYRFAEMCKIVSLRRFPAGQMHWEVSGIPRSYFLRMPKSDVPRVLSFVFRHLGGFRPCFSGHLNGRRKGSSFLLEKAQKMVYYRMAKSMELQPEILGYVATSWIHSPTTFQVSPHLAWLNSVFLEHGGLVVDMGPAPLDCGIQWGSASRNLSAQKGEFQPRKAIVVWPRRKMIEWASAHSELEDYPTQHFVPNQILEMREA